MEGLYKLLSEKTGIAKDKAEQVGNYLKEHAAEVPKWISGESSQFVSHVTQHTGIAKDHAEKLFQTLKTNSAEVTQWLGGQTKGLADKAKDAVGGLFGGK